ncbi:glutamate ligase [Bifidobacterium anseris]|uniref:Lipid II isoglutaminyl synthase (glutamine-hydrolyzing) subunit MurT n=1 Tax=Bifidobacterium anseris TaxID=2020963 RepID=A0A2N5IXQ6_9BIFI|nr:Mur ligase family protein [Bifidobacterium anseris]PLS26748.1 glutamate ligase [Bifidobacterium anseris]
MTNTATDTTRRPWYAFATPLLGKSVRWASRVTHHGGSAFPGKVVERVDPTFLHRTLAQLPLGVILVSGTNGKTTTTRMVAMMLESLGLRVFTNPTGSNFTRGVVSALLNEVTMSGHIDADIAVLELDEAYAVQFVAQVKPQYALLLNVMRDQLDRFGEIDNTARLLGRVAATTTRAVVLNREDPRIAALAALTPVDTRAAYFGLSRALRRYFPTDDDMATTVALAGAAVPSEPLTAAAPVTPADVMLTAVGDHRAQMVIDGQEYESEVKLEGVYNLYNAAAALAVVRAVQQDLRVPDTIGNAAATLPQARRDGFVMRAQHFAGADTAHLLDALAQVTPAFGRGEVIDVHGSPTELLLVKNPMGFRLALASFPPDDADTMICINDEYADGRDMSWLWDVDFTSLKAGGVDTVSGVRAWDMALRLAYDDVAVGDVDTDLERAVDAFVARNPGRRKHIYCTYTAMLAVRAYLAKIADVADAGVGK